MLVAARRLSLVAVLGLLIAVAFFTVGTGSRARRLQELQLRGSRAWAQRLRCMDLVAPRHVGFSGTSDRTGVPCTARRILNR